MPPDPSDTMSRDFLCAAVAAQILAVVVLDWAPSLPKEHRRAFRRRKPSKLKKLLRWLFDKDNY